MRKRVFRITLFGSPTGEWYFREEAAREAVRLMNEAWAGKTKPYAYKKGLQDVENT